MLSSAMWKSPPMMWLLVVNFLVLVVYSDGNLTTTSPTTQDPPPNCQDFVDASDCSWKGKLAPQNFPITADQPCTFNCSYVPTSDHAIELDVHQLSSINDANVFISVRQNYQFTAWTIPIIFEEHKMNQPYFSIEAILCPPRHNQSDTLFIRIETRGNMKHEVTKISFELKTQRLKLKLQENVTVTPTPVSPWYKLYEWNTGQSSVLVTADSVGNKEGNNVCALLSLQDAECPVGLTKESIIAGRGRYQSFQERGGMVARRELFPNGVFIVVLTLPDDSMCTGKFEDVDIKIKRHKSVLLTVIPHTTISGNWGIYAAVFIVLGMIVSGSTFAISFLIKRDLSPRNPQLVSDGEEEDLLDGEDNARRGLQPTRTLHVGGVRLMFGGSNVPGSNDSGPAHLSGEENGEQPSARPQGFEGRLRSIMADDTAVTPSGDIVHLNSDNLVPEVVYGSLPQDIVNVTNQNNPWYVYWWKVWAEYKDQDPESSIGAIGFQRNMIIVAVFMALPFTEILRSYLNAFTNNGSEDQCFFNSKCLTSLGIFSDVSRVFTNVGYVLCGLSFMYILRTHRTLNWKISAAETLGVCRNYGLFMSLAVGLIIQAFMSSMYHMCPNSVTLRLDMMFMYVDAVVLVVGVWGLRHGGVSHHVYPTVALVGVALLGAELQEFASPGVFWTFASIVHLTLTFTIGAMLWKFGTWSFSPMDMVGIWKEWKPIIQNLNEVLREERSTNASIFSFFRASIGVLVNIVIVICSVCFNVEVYMYILAVCVGNMVMYVINYVCLKVLHKERPTLVSWVSLVLAAVSWVIAISFFFVENTNIESTPSTSRALNSPCILFGVFDYHDVWHLTSAFAMYYTIVGILTLDNDLARRNPQKIPVF